MQGRIKLRLPGRGQLVPGILGLQFQRQPVPTPFGAPRGIIITAQGKAAEAAALGERHPSSSLPLSTVRRAGLPGGAANLEKGKEFIVGRQPSAALVPRLPSAIMISSSRDFSLPGAPTPGGRTPSGWASIWQKFTKPPAAIADIGGWQAPASCSARWKIDG